MNVTALTSFFLSGLILVIVIAAIVFAIFYLIRSRRNGKSVCCGSCSSCTRYGLCDHAEGAVDRNDQKNGEMSKNE